jgi:hydroxypyruvate reductase
MSRQRQTLKELLDTAIAAAQPAVAVPPHLPPVPKAGRIVVLGAGKASAAMAVAVETAYAAAGALDRLEGFVTTRHGYALPTRRIEVFEAGHPVPDEASRVAAERALALAESAGPGDLVLVLLSGGASALWSAPVAGMTLADKQALTRDLLKSGAPIGEMNLVRKHVSRIKGGRLARAARNAREILTLAISDVKGDDPAVIGSGPTVGDPTTLEEARALLRQRDVTPGAAVAAALADATNESPKPGEAPFHKARYLLVATPRASIAAAERRARDLGLPVRVLGVEVDGEARAVAAEHARLALEAKARGETVLLLSGGELTVTVTGNGIGGRNQEYALAMAMALAGAAGIHGLAAGTDGADGGRGRADDPAGAYFDATTLERAGKANLKAATFLANNDSTTFFAGIGDLIVTGPTQTNVNDFRAVLIEP